MTKIGVKAFAALLGLSMLATSLPVSATELDEPEDNTMNEESGIVDTTPPEITSLKIVESEASPTGYDFVVTCTDDMSGISDFVIYFRDDANSLQVAGGSASSTIENGVITLQSEIEYLTYSDLKGKTLYIKEIHLSDNAHNMWSWNYKFSTELPESFDTSFTVTKSNDMVKKTASDVILSYTLDKTEVQGSDSITIKAIADKSFSEVYSEIKLTFNPIDSGYSGPSIEVLLNDDDRDGEYIGIINIPAYQKDEKTYKPLWVYYGLGFHNGEEWEIEKYQFPSAEYPTFTVRNSESDTKVPEIKSIELKNDVVSVPGAIEVVADVSDDISGVDDIRISFDIPNATDYSKRVYTSLQKEYNDPMNLLNYKEYEDGLWHGFIEFDQYSASGEYIIKNIYVSDKAENEIIYQDDNIPEEMKMLSFKVVNDSDSSNKMTSTIKSTLVNDILEADDDATISVDISVNQRLPKEALEVLKGTNKTLLLNNDYLQWVIKGNEVTDTTKDIDLGGGIILPSQSNLTVDGQTINIIDDDIISIVGENNIFYIVNLAHNGDLPCKAIVRANHEIRESAGLPTTGLNIYYYNNDNKNVQMVAKDVSLTNRTNLEFEVTKGGIYIVTQEELATSDFLDEEIPTGPSTWESKEGTEGFVYRLYNVALTRDAEEAGLNNWNTQLTGKTKTAAEVAQGIFFSAEFQNHKYSDVQYVKLLYRTMFGREADEGGLKGWLDKLNSGMSREYVFRGFAESQEFENLCNSYNINRGTVTLGQYRDKNEGATGYVARLYTQMLGRKFEDAGVEYWCEQYLTGKVTIESIATNGFLHSQEFTNLNLSDEEFVTRMYQTFLNREPDEAGYKDWVGKLKSGEKTRDDLVYGFSLSQEFANLKKSYGL